MSDIGIFTRKRIILAADPFVAAPVAAAPPAGTTAFDPAKKASDLTLTNSDLTAEKTAGTGHNCCLSVAAASTTKVYFELHIDVVDPTLVGIGIGPASTNTSSYLGNTGTLGYWKDGSSSINGGVGPTLAAFTTGDTVCLALDTTNSKVWGRVNGGGWNNDILANQDPASNIGGADISVLTGPFYAGATFFTTGAKVTANFGATAYAQTKPTGYSNW